MHLILSLDGGGIRGALTAQVIERLEAKVPFLHKVDLVAGTSIGGINALYLAAGLPAGDMVELFRQHGKTIFKHRDWWDRWSGKIDECYRANYDQNGLKSILDDVFGEDVLTDLQKKVLITAFDLDNGPILQGQTRRWKAKFFHNFHTKGNDGQVKIVDAALATSAAPTYFPSWKGYVDGGMAANNPSMCAVAKAMKVRNKLDDIHLLSIGTGLNAQYIEGDKHDWGYKQWLPKLMPMIFDANANLPDYQCSHVLGDGNYYRVRPILQETIDLDDADKVEDLIQIANGLDLSDAIEWLEKTLQEDEPEI